MVKKSSGDVDEIDEVFGTNINSQNIKIEEKVLKYRINM